MSPLAESINARSLLYAEEMQIAWARDPNAVPADWRAFFAGAAADDPFAARPRLEPEFTPPSIFHATTIHGVGCPECGREIEIEVLQDRLDQMIRAFRVRGHMAAALDPLGRPRPRQAELDPAYYGFAESDMERVFSTRTIRGAERLSLRRILERLRNTYCRSIGVQFMHITSLEIKEWLQERMEGTENRLELSSGEQTRILTRLTDALAFEEFIRTKFVGAKSFSLEGAETLIPLLDTAIERAGTQGVREIVLGMAHRGRLNVLVNIIGKSPREVFREFEDADPEIFLGGGDVKYHLGYSSDFTTSTGDAVHLTLSFNPSHLEFVNPVIMGRLRAKQDHYGDAKRERGLGIMIHGDAAMAGEGVIQETFNLSQLPGYAVGGTLHIVVNNQIGFTTSPEEGRSTLYATDIARMLEIPVFHVNGEDPEAVAQTVSLALDFRRAFRRDVVIDMYCFRRRGHNEGDEPSFTQPLLYRAIDRHRTLRESYLDRLLAMEGMTRDRADEIARARRENLEAELSAAKAGPPRPPETFGGIWKGYEGGRGDEAMNDETGVARESLVAILEGLATVPAGFHLHPKLDRFLAARRAMARGERPIDWATAEALAFGSLLREGVSVRFTGQDTQRGTFSHRHAVFHDVEDGARHIPLAALATAPTRFEIHNSPLSEAGVLGFEYGYSLDAPGGLTLWEAQFGDFANTAQVIIDQFIGSAERKWSRLSGLVLLLPHGFEGMGPEHSSARLERFLLLCAEENIRVAQPTTPAQYFHLLRRQVTGKRRKPLIVMTPKSLLRAPDAVSDLEELTRGRFYRLLAETSGAATAPRRLLLCSGKLYYELMARRQAEKRHDVAIARVEQFYPLAWERLEAFLAAFPAGTPIAWVQEEPENMGAWRYLRSRFGERIARRHSFRGITRPESATPATGSAASHKLEQKRLIDEAFAPAGDEQQGGSGS